MQLAQNKSQHEAPPGTEAARRVLIVAGGTGGHIIPALAVGETLRAEYPGKVHVRYLTGSRAIERNAFAAAEEFPDMLACDAPPRLALSSIPALCRYGGSILESFRFLRQYRPDVILATGGYVCAPLLFAARVLRIPFYLHESNAVAGRVTRMFGKHAECVFLGNEAAAEGLPSSARHDTVGTPVRSAVVEARRVEACAYFGLDHDRPTMLVLGGSQGAHALNEALLEALPPLAGSGLQVIWACGPLNHKTVRSQLDTLDLGDVTVHLFDYLNEMHLGYAAADLVVSRAGASTLAEIDARGVPSILVPLPTAKDNHQLENARALASRGAALLIEERDLALGALARAIRELVRCEARRKEMSAACLTQSARECASRIARILVEPAAGSSASSGARSHSSDPVALKG